MVWRGSSKTACRTWQDGSRSEGRRCRRLPYPRHAEREKHAHVTVLLSPPYAACRVSLPPRLCIDISRPHCRVPQKMIVSRLNFKIRTGPLVSLSRFPRPIWASFLYGLPCSPKAVCLPRKRTYILNTSFRIQVILICALLIGSKISLIWLHGLWSRLAADISGKCRGTVIRSEASHPR